MNILESVFQSTLRTSFNYINRYKPWYKTHLLLKNTQWLSEDDLRQIQLQNIKALLAYSYDNVPYYKELFDSCGIDVGDIKELSDLQLIPFLTKKLIQQNLQKLRSTIYPANKTSAGFTGGSTGHSLKFYHGREFLNFSDRAVLFRNWEMCGYQVGNRIAFLWGSDVDAHRHTTPIERLKDRFMYNMIWINTFDLDKDKALLCVEKLGRFKPQLIVGYASSLVMMAKIVKSLGISEIRPKAIQSSAEMLMEEGRQLIEDAFGCRVFNRYGCREVSDITHECDKHVGMHVLMESNFVEFLSREGNPVEPGEVGRVVVTNLHNFVMPFIRYEVGDLALPSDRKCPCGRGLVLIEKVLGRKCDIITSPSGKLLHGEFFTHLFYGVEGVAQFQVIQKTLTNLEVKIVPNQDFSRERVVKSLRDAIFRYGDERFNVIFRVCDKIPPVISGKQIFTMSEVPMEWDYPLEK